MQIHFQGLELLQVTAQLTEMALGNATWTASGMVHICLGGHKLTLHSLRTQGTSQTSTSSATTLFRSWTQRLFQVLSDCPQ